MLAIVGIVLQLIVFLIPATRPTAIVPGVAVLAAIAVTLHRVDR